jgi:glycosyltransferase involved in cell wall biosynthesis
LAIYGEATAERAPRVSVCIPTIDRPQLFREAIASVAAQTWRDFEIVVGDNSGDGESQRRIDAVMSEFPELSFVLVRHPRHIDVADNFNSMIEVARGELWTCLPDDDRFRSSFLVRSVDALDRHPECAFTFADHWIVDADGTVNEPQTEANSARFGRTSLGEGVITHDRLFPLVLKQSLCLQTAMFRRAVISSLRFVPGILALDHSLFLRLSAGATPFNAYYLDERVMEYRIHSAQVSSTTHRSDFLRAVIAAFESVADIPASYAREYKAKLSREYLALAMLEAEQGSRGNARAHAIQSLRLSPGLRNALGAFLALTAPQAILPMLRLLERLRAPGRDTTAGLRD